MRLVKNVPDHQNDKKSLKVRNCTSGMQHKSRIYIETTKDRGPNIVTDVLSETNVNFILFLMFE